MIFPILEKIKQKFGDFSRITQSWHSKSRHPEPCLASVVQPPPQHLPYFQYYIYICNELLL